MVVEVGDALSDCNGPKVLESGETMIWLRSIERSRAVKKWDDLKINSMGVPLGHIFRTPPYFLENEDRFSRHND
jgi:hypothetical protein